MQEELFQIVDENDKPVGTAKRGECHGNPKLIHRGIYVIVADKEGRILLQKCSQKKDLGKGKWDISVGGHSSPGESYEEAAKREMEEELGVGLKIKQIEKRLMRKHDESEMNAVFIAIIGEDEKRNIDPDKNEIDEIRWFTIDEIRNLKKEDTTHFFWDVIKLYLDSYKKIKS